MKKIKYGAEAPEKIDSWAVENYYSDEEFEVIKNYFYNHPKLNNKNISYYGAKMISSYFDDFLKKILEDNLPRVKQLFNVENVVPSYGIFSDYGDLGEVTPHKDEGPCFYTIDLCLYENTEWPIFVDEKEYIPKSNQAILMNASFQDHSRPAVNNPNNRSGILLLHYAPPEHQFFRLPLNLQQQYVPFDESQYQFTLINEYNDIKKAIKEK